MEEFVKEVMSKFDFSYMFVVNLVTYILIKVIDWINGPLAVPTWLKRLVAVIVGLTIGGIVCTMGSDRITILYSFFVSLVSWDVVFKPILNVLGTKINYKKNSNYNNNYGEGK